MEIIVKTILLHQPISFISHLQILESAQIMKFKLTISRILSSRYYHKRLVLGIETSCDDTGAAVVDENRNVLGEGHKSQMKIHLENGGVIPHIAAHFHQENIKDVVSSALNQSGATINDISAIAVTSKPGLRGSLSVGIQYAKELASNYCKPIIPIHHMEAHALTPRLLNHVPFPFLALLASGGHCQIALVKKVDEFLLLGTSCHNSPGEVLDKIARRLKLQNLPPCYEMSGGQAIEYMAEGGNPLSYPFPPPMLQYRDCNFSFSGFSAQASTLIQDEERKHDVAADGVIPDVKDFCASLLHGYALHMAHRVLRAFTFCMQENLMSEKILIFSGGVACNSYIRKVLKQLCNEMEAKMYVPPVHLCNDNGVMIAWNGIEKLNAGVDIFHRFDDISPESDCPLGSDISKLVEKASIKVRLSSLNIKI